MQDREEGDFKVIRRTVEWSVYFILWSINSKGQSIELIVLKGPCGLPYPISVKENISKLTQVTLVAP